MWHHFATDRIGARRYRVVRLPHCCTIGLAVHRMDSLDRAIAGIKLLIGVSGRGAENISMPGTIVQN